MLGGVDRWVGWGMKQLTLATVGFEQYAKTTRRGGFLAGMGRAGAGAGRGWGGGALCVGGGGAAGRGGGGGGGCGTRSIRSPKMPARQSGSSGCCASISCS